MTTDYSQPLPDAHVEAIAQFVAATINLPAAAEYVRNTMHRTANYMTQKQRAAAGCKDAQDWLDGIEGRFNVWTNRTHTMAQLRTASDEQLETRLTLYRTAA